MKRKFINIVSLVVLIICFIPGVLMIITGISEGEILWAFLIGFAIILLPAMMINRVLTILIGVFSKEPRLSPPEKKSPPDSGGT